MNLLYYVLYKQSPSLGLITCSDESSLSLIPNGLFVLALIGYLEITAMTVVSILVKENLFSKTILLDPLQPNLSGVKWAQQRSDKSHYVNEDTIIIAWKRS